MTAMSALVAVPETQVALAPWFAVKVRTRSESLVASILGDKGFECFSPTFKQRRQYSDRIKQVDAPIFPGYVFCRFNMEERVRVLTTPTVEYVVGRGPAPEVVPDVEIDSIRRMLQSGRLARPWPYLQAGQRVRIVTGSMTGVEGILIKAEHRDRLVISIELLQRSVAMEIDRDHVRPI